MALRDVIGYTQQAVRGPLERMEEDRLAQEDRALKQLQVGSEAMYKQELARSERAKRQGAGAEQDILAQIMQDPNMPKRQDYLDPNAPPGEQKQALQNFFRDQATYIQSTYPQYADKLGIKGADVRQAAGSVDVSTEEALKGAQTRQQLAEASQMEAGARATSEDLSIQAQNAAEAAIEKLDAGTGTFLGMRTGGITSRDITRVAERGRQLQAIDQRRNPGVAPMPMDYYMDQAAQELLGGGGQTQAPPPPPAGGAIGVPGSTPPQQLEGVVPGVPGTGQPAGQPQTLREIDLRNPGMVR
jgi:hypothetical protein